MSVRDSKDERLVVAWEARRRVSCFGKGMLSVASRLSCVLASLTLSVVGLGVGAASGQGHPQVSLNAGTPPTTLNVVSPVPLVPAQMTFAYQPVEAGPFSPSPGPLVQGEKRLSFNFRSAPWDLVLRQFAAEAGYSLQIDVVPPGTLNYYDAAEYTPTQAFDILNGYLLQKGYVLLRRDRTLVVIKIADGIPPQLIPHVAIEQLEGCGRSELVSVVMSAPNSNATKAAADVKGLLSPMGSVVPMTGSNRLVVTDLGENVRRIHQLLMQDEGELAKRTSVVCRLRNTRAENIAQAINDLLGSRVSSRPPGAVAVAVAGSAPGPGPGPIPGIPSGAVPGALSPVPSTPLPPTVGPAEANEWGVIVVPEVNTNSVLISSPARHLDMVMRLVEQLDRVPPQVVIQALLVEVELGNTDEFGVELGMQDSVLFDRSVINNMVTLTETVTNPNGVQTTTQKLVSQTSDPGFQFNNRPLGNNTTIHPSRVGSQGLSSLGVGRVNGDLGFGGLVLSAGSESVSVLLRALAVRRKVDVLSRPQIRTLDNRPANIQVGQQVPVVDGVSVSAVGSANPVIRQDKAGIILTVTPHISPDGLVVIDVVAEKSQFQTGPGSGVPIFTDATSGNIIEAPIKDVSMANASVGVQTGQTIVLGGMITKGTLKVERKVPFLGDIPLLGRLFRYDLAECDRKELLIFLTPQVICGDVDSERIKREESERVHIPCDATQIHGEIFEPRPAPGTLPPQVPVQGNPAELIPVPEPMPGMPQAEPPMPSGAPQGSPMGPTPAGPEERP